MIPMGDLLTPFERWMISLDPYVLMKLVAYKLASDVLVAVVAIFPALIALARPMRFLWLKSRLRAAVLLAVSTLWITSWFWVSPVSGAFRDIFRLFGVIAPIEGPEPPPPPPSPVI